MDINLNINFNKGFKRIKIDFILLSILLLATALRIYHIGFQSPWLDELSSFQVSDPDLTFDNTHMLIMTREGFPHLYFLCLKFLSSIFGHSIVTLRMFSVVAGILSVYLMYLIIKEFVNKKTGYIAALLMAVNGFHIYHSQEARTYALLVFFILLATYRMLKYIKTQNWKNVILLGIACGLIPNAHPLGVLNIGVIYLTLFVFFLKSNHKKELFKQLFLSVIITFLVFIPVIQIIAKVGNVALSWILPPSYETIKQAFFELLGSNEYVLLLYVISVLVFFTAMIYKIKTVNNKEENKMSIIFISLIAFWIVINIGVIILKSYLDISIIVNRYFIGSFSLFIITLSYCFSLIKNKYLMSILVLLFAGFSLYSIIKQRDYYESVSKSEWNKVSNEIIENNKQNHKIYSAYGFVSNILFKNTNCYTLLREITLENHIESLRTNAVAKESFWYFDGNFRPFALNQEQQLFLSENFDLVQQIDKYDCWAKHYVLKNEKYNADVEKQDELFLKDFSPGKLDNQGNLFMFENGTIKSRVLFLKKGFYELEIEAMSFPKKPINNENAIIEIKINDLKIWKGQVGSDEKIIPIKLQVEIKDDLPKIFSISYLNDVFENNEDRNLGIKNILLTKIK